MRTARARRMGGAGGEIRLDLCFVIPIHNEGHHLPEFLASLHADERSCGEVAFLLVDNASTDSSAMVLAAHPDVRSGRWHAIREPRVGKFFAIRRGTAHAVERLQARRIGFLDADTQLARGWIAAAAKTVALAGESFGYTYGPYSYSGFAHLPTFHQAYEAYERVLHALIATSGWFSHGSGGVYPASLLLRYFAGAEVTTEMDLRQSLFALSAGGRPTLNSEPIVSSGRRIVRDRAHLHAWCLYDPAFYAEKDINDERKVDLKRSAAPDLDPDLIGAFFASRARKLACRNLVPLALFDRSGTLTERVGEMLSPAGRTSLRRLRRAVGADAVFLTRRFESLVRTVERRRVGRELARTIEERMVDAYRSPPVEARYAAAGRS